MRTLLSHGMMGNVSQKPVFLFVLFLLTAYLASSAQSPVDANGVLSVSGSQLVNASGDPVQLRGMSTHGPQWYSSCINFNSINTMVNDWGIDVLRLAMYVEEEGYITNPEYWKSWIDDVVDIAGQHGVYCLIDWHVHKPGDPWENIEEAREFWNYMSAKHAGKAHVIYEICNEPNGVDWARVKSYAEEIIPIIRNNDPESVIIVGTPNWSQDVDLAAANPLAYENIMYALHFYAGSHGASLRQKAETAMNAGSAVFVTEWGTSMANGDGGPYFSESDVWVNWMRDNNLSWCNWSYADKDEISAALEPGSCLSYQWNNTSPSGAYVKEALLMPADAWSGTGGNIKPVASITVPVAGSIYELGEEILIEAMASDADGTVVLVEFFANGQKVGQSTSSPFSLVWPADAIGDFLLVAKATDNAGDTGMSSPVAVSVLEEIIQYAYPEGVAHSVPGIIEGVHFDVGGEGIAYHDADAVHKGDGIRQEEGVDTEPASGAGNVGYVVNGEWLEYTVDVASAGTYDIQLNVASEPGGGQFRLEFDKVDRTGIVEVGSTGAWSSYQLVTVSDVSLTAGVQVMRLFVVVGDFNFSQLTFTKTGDSGEPQAPTARISASPLSGNAPLEVMLSGAQSTDADGEITDYSWNLGGGLSASGLTTSHTFTLPGTYELTLTVTDSDGLTSEASVSIIVSDGSTGGDEGGDEGCDNPQTITVPFAFDGIGEHCWVTAQSIGFINSWNVELLEINGEDFTNTWSNTMPERIDGQYFIRYKGTFAWSHFEIPQTKVATANKERLMTTTMVSPNPFDQQFKLTLAQAAEVTAVRLFDATGRLVAEFSGAEIGAEMVLGQDLAKGLYLLQITANNKEEVLKVIKK